jgi:hypothetical protein
MLVSERGGGDADRPQSREHRAIALPSTITGGASYAVTCQPTGIFRFYLNALGGAAAATGGNAAQPAFTGAATVELHFGATSKAYVALQAKVSNAAYSPTSGALATAIISPAFQVGYDISKAPAPVAPEPAPTVKAMRKVLHRLVPGHEGDAR